MLVKFLTFLTAWSKIQVCVEIHTIEIECYFHETFTTVLVHTTVKVSLKVTFSCDIIAKINHVKGTV